jgi:hypothetical protein
VIDVLLTLKEIVIETRPGEVFVSHVTIDDVIDDNV